jgi:hypothetical protein
MLKNTRITKYILLGKETQIWLSLQDSISSDIKAKIFEEVEALIKWEINRCRISILDHLHKSSRNEKYKNKNNARP